MAQKNDQQSQEKSKSTFVFGKTNYKLLIIGIGLLFLGYLLMIGGAADTPNEFSREIFSFRRLILAPIIVIAGFVVEIFAIMKKSEDEK